MPQGADLLLVHGALGDASQLAPLADRLRATRRVIVLELEGHGTTPFRDRPLRIESLATAVLEAIDEHDVASADVFGYSLGGYIALYLAATAPARISRVATLATKLAWTPDVAERECALLDPATIRAKVPKFAAALEARHTAAGWEPLLARTADLLRDLGTHPVVTGALLTTISQPVRIAVGDRDATVTIDECAEAVRRLSRGELEVLPRTPHPFERVDLDRLVASIGSFLA